jgi:Tfp pilus assembly protein PilO
MTQTRKWSFTATAVALAVLLAGWFVLVSPKLGEAAESREQTATQEQANVALRSQIQQLKAQAADLPRQEARLAAVRVQVPDNPALPRLIRDLTAAARSVGVGLKSLEPSGPAAMTGGQPAAAGAASAAGSQLMQVPVVLRVGGSYAEMEQFLNKLEELKRVFLVTGFTLAASAKDGAAGELDLNLNGRVFMAKSGAAPTTTPTAAAGTATTTGTTAPSAASGTAN